MKNYILAVIVLLMSIFFVGCKSSEMTSAKVYINQKDYPAALKQLNIEIEKRPDNVEAYFLAGQLYAELDSLDRMVEMFDRAVEIDTTYAEEINKWRQAKSGEALKKGINAYKKKKNLDKAIKWTNISINILPEYIDAWKNLGFLYQEKLSKFISSNIVDSIDYYKQKRLEAYARASELDKDDEDLTRIYAGILLENEMPDSTLAILKPILAETKNVQILLIAANAHIVKEKSEEALEMMIKAESIEPDNTSLLFSIGVINYQLSKFDQASTYFKKVIDLEPSNTDALRNYVLSLVSSGKQEEAEPYLIKILKQDKYNKEAWEIIAIIWTAKDPKKGQTAENVRQALISGDTDQADILIEKLNILE